MIRFSEDVQYITIDNRWSDEDYRKARTGPWQQLARDSARFRRRIQQTEKMISWIFAPAHLQKIKERARTVSRHLER